MSLNYFCIRWSLTGLCLAIMSSAASAGFFTRGCAALDMQVLTMIEERENAQDISPQRSNQAMLDMMHARMVCFEGRVLDALALYESIRDSLNTSTVVTERR